MDNQLGDVLLLHPAKSVKTLRRLVAFGTLASMATLVICGNVGTGGGGGGAAATWGNHLSRLWVGLTLTLQTASLPLRAGLWYQLWVTEARATRAQLVNTLRQTLSSWSWTLNKLIGTTSQATMLAGVVLATLHGSSEAREVDWCLWRAVAMGTVALASRTIFSVVYFSCTFVRGAREGEDLEAQGPEAVERRREAVRSKLTLTAWSRQDGEDAGSAAGVKQQGEHSEAPVALLSPQPAQACHHRASGSGSSGSSACCGVSNGHCEENEVEAGAGSGGRHVHGSLSCTSLASTATVALASVVDGEEDDGGSSSGSGGGGGGGVVAAAVGDGNAGSLALVPALAVPASTASPAPAFEAVACPVCLDDLQTGDAAARLPCPGVTVAGAKGHVFHEACIVPWLMKHPRCPLCCHEMELE